jgi:hypothetical protein
MGLFLLFSLILSSISFRKISWVAYKSRKSEGSYPKSFFLLFLFCLDLVFRLLKVRMAKSQRADIKKEFSSKNGFRLPLVVWDLGALDQTNRNVRGRMQTCCD